VIAFGIVVAEAVAGGDFVARDLQHSRSMVGKPLEALELFCGEFVPDIHILYPCDSRVVFLCYTPTGSPHTTITILLLR